MLEQHVQCVVCLSLKSCQSEDRQLLKTVTYKIRLKAGLKQRLLTVWLKSMHGPRRSVCIATAYGLEGPVIESRWGARFSAPVQTGPEAHPASCKEGYRVFPGGKLRPGRDADPSPPSSAEV